MRIDEIQTLALVRPVSVTSHVLSATLARSRRICPFVSTTLIHADPGFIPT